jgi:hypothetical protein
MQTIMFITQYSEAPDDEGAHPLSAEEVWDFCARDSPEPNRESNSPRERRHHRPHAGEGDHADSPAGGDDRRRDRVR